MRSVKSAPSMWRQGTSSESAGNHDDSSYTSSTPSTGSQEDISAAARDANLLGLNSSTLDHADMPERKGPMRQLAKRFWQADAQATACSMQVCKSHFDRFFRRHHCRVCGRVVCASCSSNTRKLLPEAGARGQAKNMRVCDACYYTTDTYDMRTPNQAAGSAQGMKAGLVDGLRNGPGALLGLRRPEMLRSSFSAPDRHDADKAGLGVPRARAITKLSHSVSMPTLVADGSLGAKSVRSNGDDDVSCATTPTGVSGHPTSAPTTPQTQRLTPSSTPVHVPRSKLTQAAAEAPATDALQGLEEEDEHVQALQRKLMQSSVYQGLLHHEPAALKALIRSAADQIRSGGERGVAVVIE